MSEIKNEPPPRAKVSEQDKKAAALKAKRDFDIIVIHSALGFVKFVSVWYHIDSGWVYPCEVKNNALIPQHTTLAKDLHELVLNKWGKLINERGLV